MNQSSDTTVQIASSPPPSEGSRGSVETFVVGRAVTPAELPQPSSQEIATPVSHSSDPIVEIASSPQGFQVPSVASVVAQAIQPTHLLPELNSSAESEVSSLSHLSAFRSRTAADFDAMDKAAYKYDATAFHSYGKTKPFVASILDVDALEVGLKGRSYNNELIVFNGDDSPSMLEMVISSALKFKSMGFNHWVMVSELKKSCDNVQVSSAVFFGR